MKLSEPAACVSVSVSLPGASGEAPTENHAPVTSHLAVGSGGATPGCHGPSGEYADQKRASPPQVQKPVGGRSEQREVRGGGGSACKRHDGLRVVSFFCKGAQQSVPVM